MLGGESPAKPRLRGELRIENVSERHFGQLRTLVLLGFVGMTSFVAGLIIGLPVLGWWLWPVQWTDLPQTPLATYTPYPTYTPFPSATPFPSPLTSGETDSEKEEFIDFFLRGIIDDPRYNPSTSVLHKYIDNLNITVNGTVLTFTLYGETDSIDDFVGLGFDVILAGILSSKVGKEDDWGLTRIELYWPGPNDSSARLYVDGHSNIVQVAQGTTDLSDVMEASIDEGAIGGLPLPPTTDNSSEPTCNCSYNVYNCGDFPTQRTAQTCYEYCLRIAGYDVHILDNDQDSVACELNP